MEDKKPAILIIDDDEAILRGLRRYFSRTYDVFTVNQEHEGLRTLSEKTICCVILDIKMKGNSGFLIYPKLKAIEPDLPIVFYSGFQNEHDLKSILNRYKPFGYFAKGDDISSIEKNVEEAVQGFLSHLNIRDEARRLEQAIEKERQTSSRLRQQLASRYQFDSLKGTNPKMRALKALCAKVVNSGINVLIQGETGTGKELVANIIHLNGPRAEKTFLIQNCAAIQESLFESEFFGHVKGSFSGAFNDKLGIFEAADKGTVFLDEIGEMPFSMQAKLLRLLEQGEVKRVGSNRIRHVDVRIISATNRNLEEDVAEGRFRKDLYYRLNAFKISMPPLRDIRSDIPLIARHFIDKFSSKTGSEIKELSQASLKVLQSYPFPGNVRELENEIERAILMARDTDKKIDAHHLSPHLVTSTTTDLVTEGDSDSLKEKVSRFESQIIKRTLAAADGNKTRAAEILGLSRVGLNKKIKRYGI